MDAAGMANLRQASIRPPVIEVIGIFSNSRGKVANVARTSCPQADGQDARATKISEGRSLVSDLHLF